MLQRKIGKVILVIFLVVWNNPASFGQFLISGHVDKEQNKTVYLSLLKYNEETTITDKQILFSTKTDSTGYFEFKGQLLSEFDKIYRIHSNIDISQGLQLVSDINCKNYHNFIFSNTDTIYFSKSHNLIFKPLHNTNKTNHEWKKLMKFEENLVKSYAGIKNKEAKQQAIVDLVRKVKQFGSDSLSSPLVKLLAFSNIKRKDIDLKNDFNENPEFYNAILRSLKKHYSETSYYLQYKDELSKILIAIIQQKYTFHKQLNYLLGFLIVVLTGISLVLFGKLIISKTKENNDNSPSLTLTKQEEKIAKLICDDKTNKEIANELFISLNTVKTHVRNLYSKLEVTNRQQFTEKIKNHPRD